VFFYAPAAAKQAANRGSTRESIRHYQTALRHGNLLPSEQLADMLENLSYQSHLVGNIDEAVKACQAALEIWQGKRKSRQASNAYRWLSRLLWLNGDRHQSERYGKEAVAILETLPASKELAWAYSSYSQLCMLAGENESSINWGMKVIKLSWEMDTKDMLVHALNNVGVARASDEEEAGWYDLEISLQLSLEADFREHATRAYTNIAYTAVVQRM
jgi:tetratricopeptide (TPR) repeat protein